LGQARFDLAKYLMFAGRLEVCKMGHAGFARSPFRRLWREWSKENDA
jgi:hypothetical protein